VTGNTTEIPARVHRNVYEVDGVRFPLLSAGPADVDEAVVFLHGNPSSCEDWRTLMGRVGTFARCISFDEPGFGRADKPASFDHSYDGHGRHVGRVLDSLGVRRAHLVGQDLGARWMLEWGADHPQQMASVVLIDGGVLLDYRWHYLARIWRTPVLGDLFMAVPSRAMFRLILRKDEPKPLPGSFVDRMYDEMDPATRRAILSLYRPTFDWNARSYELSRRLRGSDCPALVVWGQQDRYIPVEQAYRQRDTFPSADVAVLPSSGHWPHIDDPAGVESFVIPFLRRQTC
jgi:pimeloyl-ACP methyl ester carboxylesterase